MIEIFGVVTPPSLYPSSLYPSLSLHTRILRSFGPCVHHICDNVYLNGKYGQGREIDGCERKEVGGGIWS